MSRRFGIAALGATTAALGVSGNAANVAMAQRNDADEGSNRWVEVQDRTPLPMRNRTELVRKGELTADGMCRFTGQDVARPGDLPVVEDTVAVNFEDCEMKVERGNMTLEQLEQLDTGARREGYVETTDRAMESPRNARTTSADASDSFSAAYARRERSAFHKTYYEDPPRIDVNSVRVNVKWGYDGNCVVDSGNHVANYGWFTGSGWRRDAYNTQAFKNCMGASTSAYARYFNGVFCGGQDIRAYYDRTVITGRADGTYLMNWNSWLDSRSALCKGLLTFRRSHGYT